MHYITAEANFRYVLMRSLAPKDWKQYR